jgi:DNA-binding response OmpR family regulator
VVTASSGRQDSFHSFHSGGDPGSQEEPLPWSSGQTQVLVIEDEEGVRTLLTRLLTQNGFAVRSAETGQAGLRAIADHPASVLLVDYQLPDMDGLSLLEQAALQDPKAVAIMVTGHGTVELAVKAMRVGAADMLTKPFKPNDVLMAVRRVLEVQRLRQENRVLKQTVCKMQGLHVNAFRLADLDVGGEAIQTGSQRTAPLRAQEYERGLAEGLRRADGQVALAKQQEQCLVEAVRRLAQACADLPGRIESEAAQLAFEVARKVVHGCAEEKRDLIVEQARQAVLRVRESPLIRILAHPRDLPALEAVYDRLVAVCDGPVTVRLEADPAVAPGGCLVQTPTHCVDATLDGQLARIAEGLRKGQGA